MQKGAPVLIYVENPGIWKLHDNLNNFLNEVER